MCAYVLLFIATKNAVQALAIWRMVQKVAYSSEKQGSTSQATLIETEITLIHCSVALSDRTSHAFILDLEM